MKKNRRRFLKQSLSLLAVLILTNPFIDGKNHIKKNIKIYKKKYAKIWILDINDSW